MERGTSAGRAGQRALTARRRPASPPASRRALEPLPWRENPLFTRGPFILIQEMMERLAYNGCGERRSSRWPQVHVPCSVLAAGPTVGVTV